jgi:ATP-dependent RNA helicase DeaD
MLPPLSAALAERGYDTLTPVQEAVIAPELDQADLLVSAQTGSGKTVGFGLAIAPTLLGEDSHFGPAAEPLALVIAPTRELALQVRQELTWLYGQTRALVSSCIGGMDARTERRALERGAHIVVGTPGRLRDHIERGALDLSGLRAVVLDEADEMLDLGFREDLEFILGEAPESRRTLLFSATVPPSILKLAETFQRDAQRISTIDTREQHADITYQAMRVAPQDVEPAIFNLLRFHRDANAIVFANTRAQVNHLTARLANRGLSAVSLSGELSQTERLHALQAMRDGRARVCVATDVAARGIDLPNLSLVIHADLPTNTESLLHRSGRTGRAGRKGNSVLIVPPKAMGKATRLLKWAKISAEWVEAPSPAAIRAEDEARLMADPAWGEPAEEDQAALAARLLERFGAEAVAAAFLRLHEARHAAPEELRSPDERGPKKEARDFGPSRWIALSVGRNDRAEARWLLPLLCRAGNLDKTAIGAIRVQDSETFVELSEPAVAGFMQSLGADGALEDEVSARLLDAAPNLPQRKSGPRDGDKPFRKREDGDRPFRKREDGDRPARKDGDKPYAKREVGDRPFRKEGAKPYAKRADGDRPARKEGGKPYAKREDGARPARKEGGKPYAKREDGDRPARKDGDKPFRKGGDKPFGKREGGERSGGKPFGKEGSGPRKPRAGGDKPFRKAEAERPKGRPGSADPSQSLRKKAKPGAKPGGGKPGGKPARREGGFETPRRGKLRD